ncbi:MAG: (2Fe-2S)-binding protein [Lachnospiraceae bacterium]
MENYEICHCKHVTYSDVENALHEGTNMSDVLEAFRKVQEETACSTGCGGCYNDILDTISNIMHM